MYRAGKLVCIRIDKRRTEKRCPPVELAKKVGLQTKVAINRQQWLESFIISRFFVCGEKELNVAIKVISSTWADDPRTRYQALDLVIIFC